MLDQPLQPVLHGQQVDLLPLQAGHALLDDRQGQPQDGNQACLAVDPCSALA